MSISNRKVVIVGAGHVGSHVGYALISQSLADEIVYIDSDHAKAVAQAFDLTDATNYLPVRTKVTAGDYSDAKDAQIMIISAGPLRSCSYPPSASACSMMGEKSLRPHASASIWRRPA